MGYGTQFCLEPRKQVGLTLHFTDPEQNANIDISWSFAVDDFFLNVDSLFDPVDSGQFCVEPGPFWTHLTNFEQYVSCSKPCSIYSYNHTGLRCLASIILRYYESYNDSITTTVEGPLAVLFSSGHKGAWVWVKPA